MVGYSRLMEADEHGTLERQKRHRRELIDLKIAGYSGRIVKSTGDGLLVEFASVVDATECALAIQRAMQAREGDVSEDKRIRYRIGINLGDVVIDDGDIFGDGVNVASRLEGIAPPGGICVSASVKEQIAGKIDAEFRDLGEQQVKNLSRPIRAFELSPAEIKEASQGTAIGLAASIASGKPFVAVLPLNNMSGDPEQDYFADGMTEDLITELSRFSSLAVIARNSTFAYKGKPVRIQDVARDLGANYIVEGSVRKAGNRVRVTVQLIDAETASHIWAERYDRELTDIFEIQDELTQGIVATVSGRLEIAVGERIKTKTPSDMSAYETLMRAKINHHRGDPESNSEALRLLDMTIERDPGMASAYAWKVCVLSQAWVRGYREFTQDEYDMCGDLIEKGMSIDDNDFECLRIMCEYHMEQRDFDEAERFHEKAFRLNPNDPRIVAQRGELLTWRGKPEQGITWLEHAIRLDPLNAEERAHLMGRALFGARRYEDALKAFRNTPRPKPVNCAYAAASHVLAGLPKDQNTAKAMLLKEKPDFSSREFVDQIYYENDADKKHLLAGLSKAGLPA